MQMMPLEQAQVTVMISQQQQQQQPVQFVVMAQPPLSDNCMFHQYFCELAITVATFQSNIGILKNLGITNLVEFYILHRRC